MPKVCIYLPDRLHAEARRLDLSLSALAQDGVERAVAQDARASWVRSQSQRTLRPGALPRLDPWSPPEPAASPGPPPESDPPPGSPTESAGGSPW